MTTCAIPKGKEKQRMCMRRLRAERRGQDTSVFPKRERGPDILTGEPIDRLRKFYKGLEWSAEQTGVGVIYRADNGWFAHWSFVHVSATLIEPRFYIYGYSTNSGRFDATNLMPPRKSYVVGQSK